MDGQRKVRSVFQVRGKQLYVPLPARLYSLALKKPDRDVPRPRIWSTGYPTSIWASKRGPT